MRLCGLFLLCDANIYSDASFFVENSSTGVMFSNGKMSFGLLNIFPCGFFISYRSFIQFTTIALVFLPLMNNAFLVFSTNFGSLAWRARFALCVVGLTILCITGMARG
jgi:hypothetical protein